MPRSRSKSLESITRSITSSFARKMPLCRSIASTSVVFPWSTWAMMAMLRMEVLEIMRTFTWSHAAMTIQYQRQSNVNEIPSVVIVGRPNVGKSTLFNAILRQRRSIVGDEPGITRDRILGQGVYRGRPFELIDTGGIVAN